MSSVLLLLFCACVAGLASADTKFFYQFENHEVHFERFINEHNKQYADEHEKRARFQIFKDNLEKVIQMNEQSQYKAYGVTQFMDLTIEEFRKMYTGLKVTNYTQDCPYLTDADIPDAGAPEKFDWRENNGVTPVKNQLSCGSCYAFSSIGNIESQYLIKNKVALDLAEQQVVDCDQRNAACNGGYMSSVYRSIIEADGVEAEAEYPYIARSQECAFDANKVKVKLAGCNSYLLTSQEKLKQLLYHYGPISIAIKADALMFVNGGEIIDDDRCDEGTINHAVLLVGYGDEGEPYWIVKNSWGNGWGDQGYFKMKRGENARSCAMMNNMMAGSVLA